MYGHTLIVGGGSGMGRALASALLKDGAEVTIVGRSSERLTAAVRDLGRRSGLSAVTADVSREDDTARLFAGIDAVDHIVTTAAALDGVYRPVAEFDAAVARSAIDSKLIGPLLLAKHGAPLLRPGGSLTFTSGIAAYRPAPGGSVVAAVNGALESLTYALAIELAPIRVNAVSPGWVVETTFWDQAGEDGTATLKAMAERLPARRNGRPADMVEAFLAVLRNGFMTGTVLHVDGGHRLVQPPHPVVTLA
jgi:NAD(P)-dependent dehydrogenase (short-subunit alcohol dehydrogenase family)